MGHYTIDRAAVASLPGYAPIDNKVAGVAGDILDEAKATVLGNSYDTGELYASGFVEGDNSEYRIGFTAEHAHFVEFGTTEMNAEPFLTPAATRQRGTL